MGCPCANKRKAAQIAQTAEEKTAPTIKVEFVVRGEGHPLACENCLAKHVGVAYVLSNEWLEDETRQTERVLCTANLRCAAEHAAALGRKDFAEMLEEAGDLFYAKGDTGKLMLAVDDVCGGEEQRRKRLVAIGHMAAAEQAMRLCGGGSFADRVRAIRLDWVAASADSEAGEPSEKKQNEPEAKANG